MSQLRCTSSPLIYGFIYLSMDMPWESRGVPTRAHGLDIGNYLYDDSESHSFYSFPFPTLSHLLFPFFL